jgi:hypothetical protein
MGHGMVRKCIRVLWDMTVLYFPEKKCSISRDSIQKRDHHGELEVRGFTNRVAGCSSRPPFHTKKPVRQRYADHCWTHDPSSWPERANLISAQCQSCLCLVEMKSGKFDIGLISFLQAASGMSRSGIGRIRDVV